MGSQFKPAARRSIKGSEGSPEYGHEALVTPHVPSCEIGAVT